MKHKNKLKIARKLRTKGEIKTNVPPFQSETWMGRKMTIKKRVKKNQVEAMERAEKRKKLKQVSKNKIN